MCRIFLLWKHTHITDAEITHMLKHSQHKNQTDAEYDTETATDGYGIVRTPKQGGTTCVGVRGITEKQYDSDPQFSRVLDTFTKYSFIIGHMRKRPKWSTIRVENNHPFYYKNHVFEE